ncbi:hypothetical protein [Naasia sp. SYSU D00948]|uniref:hypothetical protein n=1 Tax=Naasia sp. SYSU D00948 TaxID=2817379 RepID=UPI001B31321B|nr:hypothetical protein [Naasia sp. SYSU D00948]
MAPYDPEAWADFAVGVVGAAAALTGLLFVAVSINLEQILKFPRLPARASSTLGLLVALLVAGTLLLTPGQSRLALGAELGVLGAVMVAAGAGVILAERRSGPAPLHWKLIPVVVALLPAVLVLVAGVTLALAAGGGLYWLTAAFVVGFLGAALNAWVLLVEIHR